MQVKHFALILSATVFAIRKKLWYKMFKLSAFSSQQSASIY